MNSLRYILLGLLLVLASCQHNEEGFLNSLNEEEEANWCYCIQYSSLTYTCIQSRCVNDRNKITDEEKANACICTDYSIYGYCIKSMCFNEEETEDDNCIKICVKVDKFGACISWKCKNDDDSLETPGNSFLSRKRCRIIEGVKRCSRTKEPAN